MSSNDKNTAPAVKDDSDLNELLDDALKDFEKTEPTTKSSKADSTTAENDDQNAFFMEQARLFSERMSTLVGQPEAGEEQLNEQMLAGFKKIAEATAIAIQGESTANDDEVKKYSDSISEALKGMNEASGTLQTGLSETDVAKLFSGLGLEEGAEPDENPFLPFMEGMMQSLLSAEILLPGIKDLLEKYPKYLEENADKISPSDRERYEKQLDLYKVICNRLESENPNETPKEKRENYKLVMEDMRKLQEYGQPPEEIVGELADMSAIDPAAAANPQCPMM
ncbi:peroxisomal biogenesis factor 19 [Episyrphus balteatus]|uniref:peroxisomal biogenesis factor 19 n=1 Tax=Episyrphus balteatus TaxID=286459 RepID=UPI0024865B19|nr:peroxisomal biogenesis factor 19 [Episyrphus balteatus]